MICSAIINKELIQLYYDGGTRIVEPYCYGRNANGTPVLKAYQVSGYGIKGWKIFDLSKANDLGILPNTFSELREDYQKSDPGIAIVFCQL